MANPCDDRWPEVERLLDMVLDLTPEERDELLDRESAGDHELRELVETYLRAASRATLLDRSLGDAAGQLVASMDDLWPGGAIAPGTRIGRYQIDSLIGEGGMGAVYLAHRADGQYDQRVALKILLKARVDDAMRLRFLRERQILADLSHPNVARLLDGGVTEDGTPYLVLEHIDGLSITEHCQSRELDRGQRLQLFLQACRGVHHAHRNGVVHRDLKPSNILVEATADGFESVSVLDFGIATVDSQHELTMTGQVVGTPGYGSPEQLVGNRHAIDRRSDIFSLGVVLYELLCDCRPFTGSNPSDILVRTIEGRMEPPRKVRPDLPVDLETIVVTCLAHDPSHRYSAARALIDDIERYLDGRPIAARPVGWLTRLTRRARRHPAAAGLAAVGLLAVGLSALALTVGGIRYARDLERERTTAVEARARAEDLLDFMLDDLHAGLQPLGRLDLLDQVARKALAYYDSQPAGSLHGDALRRRGLAVYNVGLVLEAQGHHEEAQQAYERFGEIARRLMATSPDPRWQLELAWSLQAISDTLAARGEIERALDTARQALAMARSVGDRLHEDPGWRHRHFKILAATGWLEREAGNLDAAASVLEEALALTEGAHSTAAEEHQWRHSEAVAHSYLGLVHQEAGALETAIASFKRAKGICRELVRIEPENATWLEELQLVSSRLGLALQDFGDHHLALPHLEDALEISLRLTGLEPANSTWYRELNVAYSSLAWCQRQLGDPEAARINLEEALRISSAIAAEEPDNPSAQNDLAWDLLELGRVQRQLGRHGQAAARLEEAAEVTARATGIDRQPYYLDTRFQVLLELDRQSEAVSLALELAALGWQAPDFLELCETHRIPLDQVDD